MPDKIYTAAAISWTLFVVVLCLVSFNDIPSVPIEGADKYVHGFFHFVFTLLWYLAFRNASKNNSSISVLLQVGILSLLFGILIEGAQGFLTESRNADLLDIAANFTGSLLACLLVMAFVTAKKPN